MATRGASATTATTARRRRRVASAVTAGTGHTGDSGDSGSTPQERARANRALRAIANPPGECPWCMSELGQPSTVGTTTRMCRWHEFTTWIQIATRYPVLWPKVRAEFGQAVLVRLVAPAAALADGAAGAGALVVDIAVR